MSNTYRHPRRPSAAGIAFTPATQAAWMWLRHTVAASELARQLTAERTAGNLLLSRRLRHHRARAAIWQARHALIGWAC